MRPRSTGGSRPRRRGEQVAVPCWFMRGGTSRGPFFRATDLPSDGANRDAALLAAMGSPDPRQIDGLGGGTPLTSKAGIVGLSTRADADLDFRFAQLQPGSDLVDTTPNCGNMLAAVVPFAVESGLLTPRGDTTTARVRTLNTGLTAEITVPTPQGESGRYVAYAGDTRIDGVPGSAAPVTVNFLDTAGSVCSALLPTGRTREPVAVEGIGTIEVTCIDNGQPLVIAEASALRRTGYESVAELNADTELKTRLEALRLACGELMGLGDVTAKNYPKMTLVAPGAHGGTISTRSFIPHVCHESIGVLAAVTVATACVLDGTVAHALIRPPASATGTDGTDGAEGADSTDVAVSVEHPAGEFSVELGLALGSPHGTETGAGPGPAAYEPPRVTKSALVRTARLIMAGEVLLPGRLWPHDPAYPEEPKR
ncbi:4-oxalomesaconate tautomerase [Streptomyces sp. NBC_01775]|nr:4-oxalomesaconate tautomerase [Streptomyces sp. NBC_01775]WSB81334.1 4-oxalomesaconate tautomerase [Streptomyces sp. NBC_01775]